MLSRKLKRLAAAVLCGAVLMTTAACQEDPEGSIVANKDMDKLISQGAASDNESRVDAGELITKAQETETYSTTIDSQNLGVKVEVNAKVDVPGVDKLSIYRVRQKPIDQEFLDKVRAELCGDVTLYDGSATRVRTKKDLEEEIQGLRQSMAEHEAQMKEMENDPNIPEGEGFTDEEMLEMEESYQEEMRRDLDRLQEEYEAAPTEINFQDYPTDGKIHPVKEMYERDTGSEYYQWLQSLSADGDEVFYGVSDGSDGFYQTLYAQNNADYSNQVIYRKDLEEPAFFGIMVEDTIFEPYMFKPEHVGITVPWEEYFQQKGVPGKVIPDGAYIEGEVTYTPIGSPTVEMTEDEARAMAEGLLDRLGLSDFTFSEGGLYTEIDLERYRANYIFRYRRSIEGVMLTQSSGAKYQDGNTGEGGSYNKRLWPGECVEVRVTDDGIVGFRYNAPLEITETVVEGTSLKSFDEVKGVFEQMAPMVLAENDFKIKAQVDRVRLSYSRISEKDSFDTGLVVPVWSFEGKLTGYDENDYPAYEDRRTLIAINAIDGSVIDGTLGY